jgi:hypothetical protein
MTEMSPLARLILKAMRIACLAAAVLLLAFLGLALWQKGAVLSQQDMTFIGILAVMAVGAVWLARAIGREISNPGS